MIKNTEFFTAQKASEITCWKAKKVKGRLQLPIFPLHSFLKLGMMSYYNGMNTIYLLHIPIQALLPPKLVSPWGAMSKNPHGYSTYVDLATIKCHND